MEKLYKFSNNLIIKHVDFNDIKDVYIYNTLIIDCTERRKHDSNLCKTKFRKSW
jgi:hypothetical protein